MAFSRFSAHQHNADAPACDISQTVNSQTVISYFAEGLLAETLVSEAPAPGGHAASLISQECSASNVRRDSTNGPELLYQREASGSVICLFNDCRTRCSRLSDLRRHHQTQHVRSIEYTCRASPLCKRAKRGFPRKDKRNEHEWKIHKVRDIQG